MEEWQGEFPVIGPIGGTNSALVTGSAEPHSGLIVRPRLIGAVPGTSRDASQRCNATDRVPRHWMVGGVVRWVIEPD